MHQLLLQSQVAPLARHSQVLNILAGLTAAQPTPISEQYLIYQQLQSAANGSQRKVANGKPPPRAQPLSCQKLVRDINLDEKSSESWKSTTEGVPDAGNKSAISRSIHESALSEADLERFRGGSNAYK